MAAGALAEVFAARSGVVTEFDDHVGAGRVADGATGTEWSFHCTRIAGGERTIAVGAAVSFRVAPGPVGLEAVDIDPVVAGP